MGSPRVDPEWIDPSRQGQLAPTGCAGWPHPVNYGVPQFLDAIQSEHNIRGLGALGTPTWLSLVVWILPFPRERPPITS